MSEKSRIVVEGSRLGYCAEVVFPTGVRSKTVEQLTMIASSTTTRKPEVRIAHVP